MSMNTRFSLKPLAIALGGSSLALMSLMVSEANARDLIGEHWEIDASAPVESWVLDSDAMLTINGGEALDIQTSQSTLNVVGGTTQHIYAEDGSHVRLDNATVNNTAGDAGLELVESTATITNSTISSTNTGLLVAHFDGSVTGSTATVRQSHISGQRTGAWVNAFSHLGLSNSTVEGTDAISSGLKLRSGSASASDRSQIIGGQNGVMIEVGVLGASSQLVLDNSRVEGKTGSAIVVDNAGHAGSTDIQVLNGSTLTGGNDTIVDVLGGASVNMAVGNSALEGNIQVAGNSTANLNFTQAALTGDVLAESGSTATVQLQQGSQLIGRMENVAAVGIDHQSAWTLTGNSQVGDLAMNGGAVRFGAHDAYYQLDVTHLSGEGLFYMGTHFTTGETDVLNVTGTASGQHALLIESTGVDPASGQPITVVRTEGGDAVFSLANTNGEVDLGTYSYGLSKDFTSNDWYLDPTKRSVSPSTRVVSALFNTAPTVWYGELTSLRSRMGEVRFHPDKSGAWSRVYGNKYNVDDAFGAGYRQTQQGFALGADAPVSFDDGQWLLGVMAGHSTSDLDLSQGSSGSVKSYYVGGYLTWLDEVSGYYVDGVLKLNRFQNDAKVVMSDGQRAKGDFNNTALGGSVEFGRHIKLHDGYFFEPFTQWSTVFIQGQNYDLDNGLQAKGDRAYSLLGKAGVTAGRDIPMNGGGTVQPYVRVAVAHEFSKSNEFKVNDNAFNHDLSGSRVELGAGVAMNLTDRWSVNAEVEYMNGNNIEMPRSGTVSVLFKW